MKVLHVAATLYFGLCLPFTSSAQSQDLLEDVSFNDVLALPTSEPHARLAYGTDEYQYGLLWLPEDVSSPPPLVVFIHGGCWLNSFDITHSNALSSQLSQEGFAVWSLEYRRTGDPGGGWPGSFEDIKDGIGFLNELAEYGIDTERFAIVGHSAGGHLALLAGTQFPEATQIISLAGITNIALYARGETSCEQAAVQFMGATPRENPNLYSLANPASQELHIDSILLHGEADSIVPLSQAARSGLPVLRLPGAGHFDWIHSGTYGYTYLLELLQARLLP